MAEARRYHEPVADAAKSGPGEGMFDVTDIGRTHGEVLSPILLSIVITTHNRPVGVRGAINSVLDHAEMGMFEVVVVDDGSEPETAAALDELASPVVRVLHQDDLGLGVARRAGTAVARGEWLTFLDDDDVWRPSWWSVMTPEMVDGVGLVSGGARFVDNTGRCVDEHLPRALGPAFADLIAQYLAGCFAVRREVYDAAGGYLPGLPYSHQSEMFLRLARILPEVGLTAAHVDVSVADIAFRSSGERSLAAPRLLFDSARWLLVRHADWLRRDPEFVADHHAVVAVNAARIGRWREGRRSAAAVVRHRPGDFRAWVRLAGLSSPVLGRRMWAPSVPFASPSPPLRDPLAHVARLSKRRDPGTSPSPDLLFLPWRYRENPQASADEFSPFWTGAHGDSDDRNQVPVYRLAARLARRRDQPTVLDVGCGNGHKLVAHLAPVAGTVVGLDQSSGITLARGRHPEHRWFEVDLDQPPTWPDEVVAVGDVVVCADVIEHVDDPHVLLQGIASVLAPGGVVVLSTPDRRRLDDVDLLGPPGNPRHVREWSADELELLAESAGFRVTGRHHLLPRSYSLTRTELNRTVYRALHRKATPDRRSSLVLTLVRADEVDGG